MKKVFSGRVWLMRRDIDTDIIIPTQYLGLPMEEMKRYVFEPLYPELAAQIQEGDIIVAGPNFGCSSSREMAPEVMKTAGITCVIAPSFARIFFRNAIRFVWLCGTGRGRTGPIHTKSIASSDRNSDRNRKSVPYLYFFRRGNDASVFFGRAGIKLCS